MKPFLVLALMATQALALDYKRDIFPIFEKKCFDCHSAAAKKLKGGLRLDDEDNFYKRFAKNDVVIPGDWDASFLFVSVVKPADEDGAMPPKDKGERLNEQEIRAVAQWIYEGAKIGREKGKQGSVDMEPSKILKFRNGVLLMEGDDAPVEIAKPEWEDWTNRDGRKTTAKFLKFVDGKVSFELKGEKKVDYPLEQLSEESRDRVMQRVKTGAAPMR